MRNQDSNDSGHGDGELKDDFMLPDNAAFSKDEKKNTLVPQVRRLVRERATMRGKLTNQLAKLIKS